MIAAAIVVGVASAAIYAPGIWRILRNDATAPPVVAPAPALTAAEYRDHLAEQQRAERYHTAGGWGR